MGLAATRVMRAVRFDDASHARQGADGLHPGQRRSPGTGMVLLLFQTAMGVWLLIEPVEGSEMGGDHINLRTYRTHCQVDCQRCAGASEAGRLAWLTASFTHGA